LLDTDASVGTVATQVGYSSPFTFSTAFKRQYGTSPKEHRATQSPRRQELDQRSVR
jgi:AraC-like DNA-binding protein